MTLDKFTYAYIEAALWSSTDESTPAGGEPMDANYTITDLAPETVERMKADCAAFQEQNGRLPLSLAILIAGSVMRHPHGARR